MAEAGPFPGKALKSGGQKATYLLQLPLGKFPIGRYVLQVNVLDPAAQSVAFARVPLAIVKPPAPPRAAPGADYSLRRVTQRIAAPVGSLERSLAAVRGVCCGAVAVPFARSRNYTEKRCS